MPGHDVVVVGASAGGVHALLDLVGALPADLEASVLVVLHFPPTGTSVLPAILSRRGVLPAMHPRDGEPLQPGHIYVAPPDHHLMVEDGPARTRLARGPRENGHRPAVDVLFRSAAVAFGTRVIGLVLSGSLHDGMAGVAAIKQQRGVVLVQDPEEALASGMPEAAIEHVAVDEVGPVAALAASIKRLTKEPAANPAAPVPHDLAVEARMGALELDALHEDDRPGEPSGFSCPDCGGVLWELRQGDLVRYRCRVGHVWSAEALLGRQADTLEASLWVALRSLEERSALSRRLGDNAGKRGSSHTLQRYEERATEAEQAAAHIRQLLLNRPGDEFTSEANDSG